MRLFLTVLISLLFTANVFAANVPTHVSGDTVSFNSVRAVVVTFNTATSNVWIWNESFTHDLFVDFICRDDTGKRGYATTNTVKLIKAPKVMELTPNTIELDISVRNLGFLSNTGTGTVTYRVTGESSL